MSLEKYYKKRTFNKTCEPEGKPKTHGKFRFVIHRHQASHLHWDLRLELPEDPKEKEDDPSEGIGYWVLKSWAVPKEPPEKSDIKRLAIQVEDHPVDYISFSGEIPPGQYGAGFVEIWDSGNFKLISRSEDRIEFTLAGKRLVGEYVLLKMKGPKWKGNQWLLFKK